MDSLEDADYKDSLAIVAHHWYDDEDSISPPEVNDRAMWYGFQYQGVPGMFFDGSFQVEEEDPDKYPESFIEAIEFQKGNIPPFDLVVDYNLDQVSGSVKITIFANDTVPSGDNRLFIAITEDSVHLGFVDYDYVTRAMLPDWEGMPLTITYAESLETTFTFINEWNVEKVSIIGFIQNMDSKHILQTNIGKINGG